MLRWTEIETIEVKFQNSGRIGYIDYLMPSKILVEMESKGKSFDTAYAQATEYVNSLKS